MKKMGLIAAAALTAASVYAGEGIEINKTLSLGGFIDASFYSLSDDASATADRQSFAVDQAELDFHLNFDNGLTARVDVNGGRLASSATAGTSATNNADIEQARIDLAIDSFTITMGKFDTFIGMEALEPVDMYTSTHGLTWDLEPTQQTGIIGKYDGGMFELGFGLVNSLMNVNPDNNDEITFHFHGAVKPLEGLRFGLCFETGEEGPLAGGTGAAPTAAQKADAQLLSLDIQYKVASWYLGFEYVTRTIDVPLIADIEDKGYELMVNYAFTEMFSLTGRYGTNEGTTGDNLTEMTLAPILKINPNWEAKLEYRSQSGGATYTGATPGIASSGKKDATRIALETTLKF